MVNIFSLRDISYKVSEGAGVIKAEQLEAIEQGARLVAQAREKAAEIIEEAQDAYSREKDRGYKEGQAAAQKGAFDRLVREHAVLEAGLRRIDSDLADVVFRAVRKIIDGFDDFAQVEAVTRSALKQMRRQKRMQLRVPSQHRPEFAERIGEIVKPFPEIELIDVVEDAGLLPHQIVLESDIGSVDGDLEDAVGTLQGAVERALTNQSAKPHKSSDAAVQTDD